MLVPILLQGDWLGGRLACWLAGLLASWLASWLAGDTTAVKMLSQSPAKQSLVKKKEKTQEQKH